MELNRVHCTLPASFLNKEFHTATSVFEDLGKLLLSAGLAGGRYEGILSLYKYIYIYMIIFNNDKMLSSF